MIISGSSWAGIATAGRGIGVPVFLLTSAEGALLGKIIEEIKNQKKGSYLHNHSVEKKEPQLFL